MQDEGLWADLLWPPHPEGRTVVSYESRQKKRRYKRTEARARNTRTPEMARRWYLTVAKRPGRFDCCRQTFERGAAIVFRYEPRAIRCQRCAAKDPESKAFRVSLRYDRARRAAG